MKFSHWIMIFLAVSLFVFGVGWRLNTKREISFNTGNRQYSVILADACVDAMKETEPGLTDVFNTKEKRERSLDAFYLSLSRGLNKNLDVYRNSIIEMTPFVLLIDNDGFYISYNAAFDEYMTKFYSGGTEISPDSTDVINTMTNLNTWSEIIDSHTVRFYLNDHVQVLTPTNELYDGTLSEVSSELPGLAILQDRNAFEEERRYVITTAVEDEINYLLNSQPMSVGKYYKGYVASMSQSIGEDWHRLLVRPCVISFLQGDIERNGENTLNVYAYAGGEVIKSKLFYGQGDLYYKYDGTTGNNFGTMRNLAEKGYNPDLSAMWDN